jgi:hypothetical protein
LEFSETSFRLKPTAPNARHLHSESLRIIIQWVLTVLNCSPHRYTGFCYCIGGKKQNLIWDKSPTYQRWGI